MVDDGILVVETHLFEEVIRSLKSKKYRKCNDLQSSTQKTKD
jgi:hypothetical protein